MSDIEFSNAEDFSSVSITFFKDDGGDHYWRLTDSDNEPVNRSSEGFSSLGNAKNNLLILHTLVGVNLLSLANGIACGNIEFYDDDSVVPMSRWRVKSDNHEIVGASHKGFDSGGEAKNNLLMTYSLISTCLAQTAAFSGQPDE